MAKRRETKSNLNVESVKVGIIEDSTFIQQSLKEQVDEEPKKQRSTINLIVNDKRTQFLGFFVLFALVVPVLLYYFLIDQGLQEPRIDYSCLAEESYRVPCGAVNVSSRDCKNVRCCLDPKTYQCYHYIPSKYAYLKYSEDTSVYQASTGINPFFNSSISQLQLTIREVDAQRLQIILHHPSVSYQSQEIPEKDYLVKLDDYRLGVEVLLKNETSEEGPHRLIFTTFRGPLIGSDGYWEWTFQVPNGKLFGLGELALKENRTTKVIYKSREDHNAMANFMIFSRGRYYGVVVEHDGPLEVSVLPSRLVILRSLAGKRIVLNLSLGPTPALVMKQQRLYEPLRVPYWVLGAHICRDGLTTMASAIEEYKTFEQNEKAIQFASDCIHENLYTMLSEPNTDLPNLIGDLQAKSHFVMSVPPQILKWNAALYNKAVELGVLYKEDGGEIFNGTYREQAISFPDFAHDSIDAWMAELAANLPLSDKIGGFVLKDNWPEEENYTFSDDLYKFPHLTEDLKLALNRTIPWNIATPSQSSSPTPIPHIEKHNRYGSEQLAAFKRNLPREFLMTSSYDYGTPEAAQVQHVNISWTNLKRTVTTTLYHSIFGSPLISIPVCGSTDHYDPEAHEKLCIRWYIAAATLPLFRISSDFPRRDPSSLATGFAREAALKALRSRYALLPYYYTTLNEDGAPLVRPMFYDFHFDVDVLDLDEQYMVGESLLVAQPLLPESALLRVYLPPSVGTWYEFWGGKIYNETGWNELHVVDTDWVMFIAQGRVVPLRNNKEAKVGAQGPQDTISLAIALNCTKRPCIAEGSLKFNTNSLKFFADEKGLTISNIFQAVSDIGCNLYLRHWSNVIETVVIYGIDEIALRATRFPGVDLCKQEEDEIYVEYHL